MIRFIDQPLVLVASPSCKNRTRKRWRKARRAIRALCSNGGGLYRGRLYPRHSKNRRTDRGTYLSLSRYGAVIRADTRSLYGLYFDSIEPPSFATFALLSRRQTVEIDKIRERGERKGVTWRNWRGGNATLIKSRRFWDFTRRDEAKTRRCSFVLRIRSRTAFLALTMTSVTWRLCTRKRRWLLRFGSNYDRGAENSLVCCCHPRYRQTISPGEFWQIVIAFEKG